MKVAIINIIIILGNYNVVYYPMVRLMKIHEFGDPGADIVLVQLSEEHEAEFLDSEAAAIKSMSGVSFRLDAVMVDDWNRDLSPWEAPAVFGDEGFGGGAAETLKSVLDLCDDTSKTFIIGGYSLAGLFALWAAYQTDLFKGIAAASPSMWFSGFLDYMKEYEIKSNVVYLSLGDKEEKTRNPVMAAVGARIREAEELLSERNVHCTLEWNQGNHFRDPDLRTAKAFSWAIQETGVITGRRL